MKKSNSKVLGFTALAAAAGGLVYFFTRKKEVAEKQLKKYRARRWR